jgi:hypothetical protein
MTEKTEKFTETETNKTLKKKFFSVFFGKLKSVEKAEKKKFFFQGFMHVCMKKLKNLNKKLKTFTERFISLKIVSGSMSKILKNEKK